MLIMFLVTPQFTWGYAFILPKNCELSGEIKMEICIIGKTRKIDSYKTVSQFTINNKILYIFLAHNTIKRLDCVVQCLNMKMK